MANLRPFARSVVTLAVLSGGAGVCCAAAAAPASSTLGSAAQRTDNPTSPAALFLRFYKASVRARWAAQHIVTFDGQADAGSASAIADAADAASDAIVASRSQPDGKRVLLRIKGVSIAAAPAPNVTVNDGVIDIGVDPFAGEAGRPSLITIEQAIDTDATKFVDCDWLRPMSPITSSKPSAASGASAP